jgi:membrane-associated phospholipid phosphatase
LTGANKQGGDAGGSNTGSGGHRPRIAWSLIAPGLLALAAAVALQTQAPQRALFLAFNQWASQFPASVWSFLTLLGEADVLFCLISPLLLWRPQMMLAVLAAVPLGGALSVTLKALFQAQRPANLIDPAQFNQIGLMLNNASFPSGHTITAFAAALAVLAVQGLANQRPLPRPDNTRRRTPLLALPVLAFAAVIGLSRVAVGAHWPVDVLAGAACGWLAGLSGAWLSARYPQLWRSALSQFLIGQFLLLAGLWLTQKTIAYPAGALAVWLAVATVLGTVGGTFLKMRRHLRDAAKAKNQGF